MALSLLKWSVDIIYRHFAGKEKTMQLAQFLDQKHVILDIQGRERLACLQQILEKVSTDGYLRNKMKALRTD